MSMVNEKVIAIYSGGLDSTVLVYHLMEHYKEVELLTFDYGQRHRREIDAAMSFGNNLYLRHDLISLQPVGALLSGSSLTDLSVPVPDGHYADETMRITVVPNRNMIMLSIAAGIAISRDAPWIATAVHSGDHAIYPDCRVEFIQQLGQAIWIGNDGFFKSGFGIEIPFIGMTKAEIVARGTELGVPFALTYSCYKGGEKHCGTCGTCVERREAFELAGVPDPTVYEGG
jgi:7-cyano-7-deazaguanine synthase